VKKKGGARVAEEPGDWQKEEKKEKKILAGRALWGEKAVGGASVEQPTTRSIEKKWNSKKRRRK